MKKLLYNTAIGMIVFLVGLGLTMGLSFQPTGTPYHISDHMVVMNPKLPAFGNWLKDGGINGLTFAFTQTGVVGLGAGASTVTGTFAASQIDTFVFNRERGVSALAFGLHAKDSLQLHGTTAGRVIRMVDGTIVALPAADTLTGFTNFTSTTDGSTNQPFSNGVSVLGTITLAPVCDQYWVILKYAATGNGTTTPNYKAEFVKTYSYQ